MTTCKNPWIHQILDATWTACNRRSPKGILNKSTALPTCTDDKKWGHALLLRQFNNAVLNTEVRHTGLQCRNKAECSVHLKTDALQLHWLHRVVFKWWISCNYTFFSKCKIGKFSHIDAMWVADLSEFTASINGHTGTLDARLSIFIFDTCQQWQRWETVQRDRYCI
jgi:hypothetical protein